MRYLQRLKKLQKALKEKGCDALIIDDPTNLYYLTGQSLSAGKLLVHTGGAELLVDSRYYEMCKKGSPWPVRLSDKLALSDWLCSPKFPTIASLGFDSANTTYKGYQDWQKVLKKMQENAHGRPQPELVPLESPLKLIRCLKDPGEVKLLREAAQLGSEGFDFVCSLLKTGISEIEIAVELEIFWKRKGGKALAFDPIIAFGANGSMPHYRAGRARLKTGDAVLIDIGVNLNHYHSDMTRVVFFGKPDARMKKIYSIVKEAQEKALGLCRPGIALGDLDAAARDYISSQGYGENFTHSLGHGIGLEIHEFPIIRKTGSDSGVILKPGMAITIEPGIYLPDIGGVRIEDTVVITRKGHENLTERPKEMIIL